MKTLQTETLETVEQETGSSPQWAVIWLHGLGADGHDFAPIVPALVQRDWPSLRFVFPHAPARPVTINGGMRMRAWYDIAGLDLAAREDAAGIRQSVAETEKLIAREAGRGIPAKQVFLAGFSQGGAIALSAALRHRDRLAGIIALSTYLPLADAAAREQHVSSRGLPVFMGHGNLDSVVPEALGAASRDHLRQLGCDVEWHRYPIPHSVSPEEVVDLARWLEARFKAAG